MPVEPSELEFMANELRERAGIESHELPLASEIAVRLLGQRGFAYGHPAAGARLDGHRIIVPKDHPDLNFVIAHELGEWGLKYLWRVRGSHRDKERLANDVAAALLAPRQAVEAAVGVYGEDVQTLSRVFAISQTSMVLRLAIVLVQERGVVTAKHHNVIVRNPEAIDWSDPEIVRVAKGERDEYPGLVKSEPFRGGIDEGRVAFRATKRA